MAEVVMIIDGIEYVYGKYPFSTQAERNNVNELAMKIRNERDVATYVREVV